MSDASAMDLRIADAAPRAGTLAGDLRSLRKARSMTLVDLAGALDRSVGWLSQVERGLSSPSIGDLRRFAQVFDVPLGLFFANAAGPEAEDGAVVRAAGRRSLGTKEEGLVEELLSPDLGGSFEILRSEFAPRARLAEPALRPTEEAGYVIAGTLDLEIDGVWHRLDAGDSFRFKEKPFRWKNDGAVAAVVVWVISPPVY